MTPALASRSLPPLTLNAWLRFDCIDRALSGLPGVDSILEVGAGQGALGARLARRFRYVGLEPDPVACAVARRRIEPAGTVLCGDTAALERGAEFDVVGAFEVLEHLEDEDTALSAWRERLRRGGWLMLSVPPFEARWGPSDIIAGHYRRYEPARLRDLLVASGFDEPRVSLYGFPLGYALQTARNVLARVSPTDGSLADRTAASGRWHQPPDWLAPVTQAVTAPFRVLQRPFLGTRLGTGLFAVVRRRD